jgi:16S rRNA A1518/A1519 N6-dimethyltransferase RsmA/KsgA/DIM1 with predicted DNA glycosylase/AP lyase activity
MSNTPMEHRTNREVIRKANGHVFIAGLGIGMILLPIQEKENVSSIIVLEKFQAVIDIVAPQLPLNDKVTIIKGDVFDYQFPNGTKFDTIYCQLPTA